MKISVITTTYNRAELLLKTCDCLHKSVLAPANDLEFEHIIYDDGSTDATRTLINEASFPNTKLIAEASNRGQSYGRNQAIKMATGDYIFTLDSDDIVLQRTIFNFYKAIKANPSSKWFIADFVRVDKDLSYMPGEDVYGWDFNSTTEIIKAVLAGEHFNQGNVLFTRELAGEVGGYDENLRMGEDIDLYLRFLLAGQMPVYMNFISHLHRIHSGNTSAAASVQTHKLQMLELKEKYKSQLTNLGIN